MIFVFFLLSFNLNLYDYFDIIVYIVLFGIFFGIDKEYL